MATMVFSAAGAAIGGAIGGSLAGVSAVAVGRLAGALVGSSIDQRILGKGSDAVETGRIDRYRITGSAEGRAVPKVYGRMRVGGQVIWATQYQEHVTTTGGGKGGPSTPTTSAYSYTVSLAVALCEGEITGVMRLWADGREVSASDLTMRVYPGDDTQLPDPKIEAVEGTGKVPAYRGTAYVVFEDLDLAPFGNRVPQFSFEVSRPSPKSQEEADIEPTYATQAVALIPGTGDYALATEPVYYQNGPGDQWAANVNAPSGQSDFVTAMDALDGELPNCGAVSLIVSWFGNDLRCGDCLVRPMVEKAEYDGTMPWSVAGQVRGTADVVPLVDGRPVYGGTPSDQSVIQAIQHMNDMGKAVMYYPFILMDQLAGNGLPDPWSDADDQAVLPWRGRITLSKAPGQVGSPDGMAAADAQVDAFFGTASASDFAIVDGAVVYSGPQEWRYRRFILHQAALCAAAGGVDSFCIGSEMRSLTWIRGAGGVFVAVAQLRDLAAGVRTILGPDVKLGYAADWSEYFGYQPQDGTGDRYFHLDPLWADDQIDFIGIDNYMPLSDWRDGDEHADAAWGDVYNLDYLKANIEGGAGYDWYYHSQEAEDAQIRTPITDGAHGEPWVYRYKDIRNWWSNAHHERIGGERQASPTAWEPQSKPIWFTELGCAAIDKATNEPNKFLDPKSSESTLPKYSSGLRDEFIQLQYLKAMYDYWGEEENNPTSEEYKAPMIDMSRAFVWAWDTRPFPRFPQNEALWSDGRNYDRGHWISGRTTHRSLASVVREICEEASVGPFDVSKLHGVVRGYAVDDVLEPRKALQPLMLRYGFDAVEHGGVLHFIMRGKSATHQLDLDALAVTEDTPNGIERHRHSDAETVGRVRVNGIEALGDFESLSEEAILSDETAQSTSSTELNMSLLRGEARQVAERWLAEARVGQDGIRFALPPSQIALGAGDVLSVPSEGETAETYRIDRVEQGEALQVDATRIEPSLYEPAEIDPTPSSLASFAAAAPVHPLFMDLPLLSGDEVPHSPHIAIATRNWPGSVAVYDALGDGPYQLNTLLSARSTVGLLETPLSVAQSGVFDRGAGLRVRMISGQLSSVSEEAVLNGANLAVIGDGSAGNWEVIQFQTADLVGAGIYELSNRLRGQAGTDALATQEWPVGSWFVLINARSQQIELTRAMRGIERTYRVGPAQKPFDDSSYVEQTLAFVGNGLRPYAPVHLRSDLRANGDLDIRWIRRTRQDGDSWDVPEVPLGEEAESYQLEFWQNGQLVRSVMTDTPNWTYSQPDQNNDGLSGLLDIKVAQVSARYGAGPFAQTTIGL
ncbi:glycoside hydrolase/phage tail family protein [Cognatishimia sp. 1_MG-2023]|uniref:baseplate multidomain protein megatron n=1 Tax=Cognatishimia sp. 1_MG-2023 TaxID=3062642 RepID=UPI0026E1F4AD|nr:glycoside hydrolase/phage tail family protein [Cognatishimia sp. 1_MG-2023]MDO6727240.1 glycoside hydrolase/phage tail family protein [Cognatishimia sp. 1_MG-2023]